jgi:tetratricopeptide (TPR) repeat protein
VEGAAEPQSADPGLRARAESIVKRLSWMRGRNCFQILGVGLDCSDDEVRRSYHALRTELDPGRLEPDLPAEARRAAHEAVEAAARAFEALATREKREIYTDSLRHGGEVPMNPAERQLRAEASYREGLMALKRGRLDEAIDRLGWAADLNPDEPDYLVQLAMARMKRETGDRGKDLIAAEAALRRALEAAPQNAEPLYQMGRLQVLRKKPREAASWMERALQCDPRHAGAALELKTLKKSGLGKLFGKR